MPTGWATGATCAQGHAQHRVSWRFEVGLRCAMRVHSFVTLFSGSFFGCGNVLLQSMKRCLVIFAKWVVKMTRNWRKPMKNYHLAHPRNSVSLSFPEPCSLCPYFSLSLILVWGTTALFSRMCVCVFVSVKVLENVLSVVMSACMCTSMNTSVLYECVRVGDIM